MESAGKRESAHCGGVKEHWRKAMDIPQKNKTTKQKKLEVNG